MTTLTGEHKSIGFKNSVKTREREVEQEIEKELIEDDV